MATGYYGQHLFGCFPPLLLLLFIIRLPLEPPEIIEGSWRGPRVHTLLEVQETSPASVYPSKAQGTSGEGVRKNIVTEGRGGCCGVLFSEQNSRRFHLISWDCLQGNITSGPADSGHFLRGGWNQEGHWTLTQDSTCFFLPCGHLCASFPGLVLQVSEVLDCTGWRKVNEGGTPSLPLWESHHPCHCFEVSHTAVSHPSPMLYK